MIWYPYNMIEDKIYFSCWHFSLNMIIRKFTTITICSSYSVIKNLSILSLSGHWYLSVYIYIYWHIIDFCSVHLKLWVHNWCHVSMSCLSAACFYCRRCLPWVVFTTHLFLLAIIFYKRLPCWYSMEMHQAGRSHAFINMHDGIFRMLCTWRQW